MNAVEVASDQAVTDHVARDHAANVKDRGVNAVVTTGIYCRSTCAGRPNPQNVHRYSTAAAAEAAGFRACLRCRPYRFETNTPVSASELVCRAVDLIADGGFDDSSETVVARAIGVSPRHLRRLFTDQLGVTADALARSRRAHFARRLLDDTDLDVTQISFAAGFGSVRQFNRTIKEIFRETPTALRAKRRVSDRLHADGGLPLRLQVDETYDFDDVLGRLAREAIPELESVTDTHYRRVIDIDDLPAIIEVSRLSDLELLLVAHLPSLEGLAHVVHRIRGLLGLGVTAATNSWSSTEQQIRVEAAGRSKQRRPTPALAGLVHDLGAHVDGVSSLGLSRMFPTAAVLQAHGWLSSQS